MKEITRVHLAKTSYDIEVGAKKDLEIYLNDIERMMGSAEDAMYEIEARMVELLGERGVASGGVISASDVADLRSKMGEPREFSDGEVPEEPAATTEPGGKPVKRLMRDPDNAVLGGVCAGIAAYWGINPLWIRILFIVSPFITIGTSILIYIVMWISMPEAKTAAEKLQMRGEEVTLDSLKNFSVSDDTKTQAKNLFEKILQVFVVFTMFVVTLGLIITLMVGMFAGFAIIPLMDGFHAQPWAWALFVSLIIGGAAAVTLFGLLTSSAVRWKFGRSTLIGVIVTTVIGALSVSSVAISGVQTARELTRDEQRLTQTMQVKLPPKLDGVKYVEIEGDGALVTDVRGAASSTKPKVDVQYWQYKDTEAPKVTTAVRGDTLYVTVERGKSNLCQGLPWIGAGSGDFCRGPVRVNVYGLYVKPHLYDAETEEAEPDDITPAHAAAARYMVQ